MTIIFKIINTLNENYKFKHNIIDSYEGIFNKEILMELLISWHFTVNEINQINFKINDEIITDIDYIINKGEIKYIFILSDNEIIIQKLQKTFSDYVKKNEDELIEIDSSDDEINKSYNIEDLKLNNSETNLDSDNFILTDELINKINLETITLLTDNDFKNLLNIYKKKPELFNILYQYIQNIDIIDETIKYHVDDNKLTYYKTLAQKINFLGFPDTVVIKQLIKYNGHLNLTIRSLFQNSPNEISL
jgi:hypothetical protein